MKITKHLWKTLRGSQESAALTLTPGVIFGIFSIAGFIQASRARGYNPQRAGQGAQLTFARPGKE